MLQRGSSGLCVIFRFGDCTVDTSLREVCRAGKAVHVEPQVFDLLAFLIEHRDRVVSKDDILNAIWEGRIVSEAALSSRINAIRRALGDTGEEQRLIRTFSRRGFRFVAELEEGSQRTDPFREKPAPPLEKKSPYEAKQTITFCTTADGVHLAVARVGLGPTLVKVANWLSHVEYDWQSPIWSDFNHHLAERYRLIRYDARGNGLSDWTVDEISFEAFVRDLGTVIDAQKLERVSLLGISQGAAVALAYAAQHPDRVDKLVLHGGYARGRNRRGSAADRDQAHLFLTLMRQGWGDEHSVFMKFFSAAYLPDGTPEQIRWYTDLQRVATTAENAVRIRHACDEIDILDLLGKVDAPVLVLHSRHDNVVPFDQGRLLAASLPNARFVTLESHNHIILPEEPAWRTFTEEIDAFLA
jgi:DNA-binding winged helix-turn-helix (wHTH) protein/pimeloyl-ACP methyl ester carboxylesterase